MSAVNRDLRKPIRDVKLCGIDFSQRNKWKREIEINEACSEMRTSSVEIARFRSDTLVHLKIPSTKPTIERREIQVGAARIQIPDLACYFPEAPPPRVSTVTTGAGPEGSRSSRVGGSRGSRSSQGWFFQASLNPG